MTKLIAFTALLFACQPDDGRRVLSDIQCPDAKCTGRWESSTVRSTVHRTTDVLDLPDVDSAVVWDCDPDPDVDYCVEVDENGHIGCFRDHDGWSVAVAPECAVDGWIPVGNGMMAKPD